MDYLSKTGDSALHILTKRGSFEAAMVLLTHGAYTNLKGQDGNTALHLAMQVCQGMISQNSCNTVSKRENCHVCCSGMASMFPLQDIISVDECSLSLQKCSPVASLLSF